MAVSDVDPEAAVAVSFQQAGITPLDNEIAAFVTDYPGLRAGMDALYAVPGVRYESPAITFDPRKAYRAE